MMWKLVFLVEGLVFIIVIGGVVAAIDNLNANVQKLSADVDALIAKGTGGVPEAAVQSAADAVAALDTKVTTALGTPIPTP